MAGWKPPTGSPNGWASPARPISCRNSRPKMAGSSRRTRRRSRAKSPPRSERGRASPCRSGALAPPACCWCAARRPAPILRKAAASCCGSSTRPTARRKFSRCAPRWSSCGRRWRRWPGWSKPRPFQCGIARRTCGSAWSTAPMSEPSMRRMRGMSSPRVSNWSNRWVACHPRPRPPTRWRATNWSNAWCLPPSMGNGA